MQKKHDVPWGLGMRPVCARRVPGRFQIIRGKNMREEGQRLRKAANKLKKNP